MSSPSRTEGVALLCPPELVERIERALDSSRRPTSLLASVEPSPSPPFVPKVTIIALGASLSSDEARIAQLTRSVPGTAIVALAPSQALDRAGAVRRLLRAGVRGIVELESLQATLDTALDVVLSGELCLPAGLRDELARPALSHREKEILMLVAEGFTNSEIATRLYLSESTVKSHLTTSFRKLHVSTRAEAAKRALEQAGTAEPPPSPGGRLG